jgi:hypothetical protein
MAAGRGLARFAFRIKIDKDAVIRRITVRLLDLISGGKRVSKIVPVPVRISANSGKTNGKGPQSAGSPGPGDRGFR